MKRIVFARILPLLALFSALSATAANLYWDSDGATAGGSSSTNANGTWGSSTFWSTSSTGAAATAGWTSGETAVFSAGTDVTGTSSITLSGTQTAAGIIVEEGIINFTGTGSASIGGGSVTIGSGATLSIDNSARIAATAGATITLNGGTMRNTVGSTAGSFVDVDAGIVLGAAGGTLNFSTANILNIVQTTTVISGSGSMTKTGAGVLAIASPSTYTGATIINEGELRVRSSNDRLPTATDVTVNSPGILNLNGLNQTIASLSGNGRVGLANGTLTINGSGVTTFTGTIEDTANAGASGATNVGGRVVRSGSSGTTILSGNNTYTGGTTKSGNSILKVGHNNALGTGRLLWSGGTISSDGVTARTLNNAVDITNNVTLGHATDNGTLTFQTGAWTLASPTGIDTNRTLTVNSSVVIDSIIGESAGVSAKLTKAGNGSLTLRNNNSFSGGFQINAGTAAIGHNSAFGSGTVTLNGGTIQSDSATARVLNNAVTLAANTTIGGSGVLTFQNGAWTLTGNRTLTVNNTADTTISSAIGEDAAGRSLTKAGSGKLILTGVNTYTGRTTVTNSGTLALSGSGSLASTNITVAEGATLDVSGRVDGKITLASGQTLGGSGNIVGGIALGPNAVVAPGSSVGELNVEDMEVEGPAIYALEMDNAVGTPGTDWDLINGTGALTLDLSLANPWTIMLSGNAAGFNNTQDYTWIIAQFAGGVTGFDPSFFEVNTSGFLPELNGTFVVGLIDNKDVTLSYSAVPEPSTIALGAFGGLALAVRMIRRRK